MKLEAVSPNNSSAVCVASIARIFDPFYFLVTIDNLISAQDEPIESFVVHKGSPCVFPMGFCYRNGIDLLQPKGKQ